MKPIIEHFIPSLIIFVIIMTGAMFVASILVRCDAKKTRTEVIEL